MKCFPMMLLAAAATMTACGGANPADDIAGSWTLVGFADGDQDIPLTACDTRTTWRFTTESAGALGDGTAVQALVARAPDDCAYYGFEAKWTVNEGRLFVSTSRIGGLGGQSLAGLMEIVELSGERMVLRTLGKELTFDRQAP